MKRITAVIRPEKLDAVKQALRNIGPGMTVIDVRGQGRQKGVKKTYRGSEYCLDLLNKVQIDMIVNAEDTARITQIITLVARTGKVGDGKTFVSDIEDVIRIRTGDSGRVAI